MHVPPFINEIVHNLLSFKSMYVLVGSLLFCILYDTSHV